MAQKTSLERSHSASSNFKLTMITFLASLSFCGVFVGIALLELITKYIAIIVACGSGVLLLLSLLLIRRFVR